MLEAGLYLANLVLFQTPAVMSHPTQTAAAVSFLYSSELTDDEVSYVCRFLEQNA